MLQAIRSRLHARLNSEQFTYVQLRNMFFPLVMDQLFIFGINMLATAMVSSSGTGAVAAVTLVSVIGNMAYALFSAIAMGGAIVVARARGANDPERVRRAIGQSMSLSLIISLLFTVLLSVFAEPLIKTLYASADPSLIHTSIRYLKIYVLSFPFYAVFNVVFNAFRSLGEAKSSLILTIVINSIHLICSYIYINVLKLSTLGSGLSFLSARVIGFAFAIIWLFRRKSGVGMRLSCLFRFDSDIIRDILGLGAPFAFEQLLTQGGMLLVNMYLAKLSTPEIDAHSISLSIFNLYNAFAYAITAMTGTVCGQCVGAKRIGLAREYCKSLMWIGRWVLLIAFMIIMPLTPLIMNLYAPVAYMRRTILLALLIAALPMPLVWCEGYVIPAATRTAGDANFTSVISLVALGFGRLCLGYIFTIVCGLGIAGIWLGQLGEWLLRAAIMSRRLETEKWIHVAVE